MDLTTLISKLNEIGEGGGKTVQVFNVNGGVADDIIDVIVRPASGGDKLYITFTTA